MSKKQWLVLLMLFLLYLLLGASIFYHIESPLEVENVENARRARIEINALLHENYVSEGSHDQHEILVKLSDYCGKPVTNYTEGEEDQYKWDFYNSFYFAYTVVSTIGYGNLAPTNMLGRILMIFYGLIGIPVNGILLAQLGEYFGHVFVKAHKKYKAYKGSRPESPSKRLVHLESSQAGLTAQIFMYLAPGFVMFIFFPAFLFSYWEGWTYDESVYYAFVTLTTIGFGDYVAGQDNTKGTGVFWILYKIFLISWIVFGLGYIVMIMGFIAQGMRSKKITRIERKLAMNLKHTQSRIWNEVNKDVDYIRRVFNELYLMRLKPTYEENYVYEAPLTSCFDRYQSFPDLRELAFSGLDPPGHAHPLRRARSEIIDTSDDDVTRVASDNDLEKIGMRPTPFSSHAMVQPGELLANLVNVLGYMPPPPPPPPDEFQPGTRDEDAKGIHGFSDREILANEKSWQDSGWKIGGDRLTVPSTRHRTASEARYPKEDASGDRSNDWTWSGPMATANLQELMNSRRRSSASANKETKSRIPSFSLASVPKNIRPKWLDAFVNKRSGEQSRDEAVPTDDLDVNSSDNYFSHTQNTTKSGTTTKKQSMSPNYYTHTGGSLPHAPDANLLEQTSLADFLRALTALHSRVGAVPDEFAQRPQRKLGTASLTPPHLPSLATLFAPPSGYATPNRSHQNTFTVPNQEFRRRSQGFPDYSGTSTPSYPRTGGSLLPNAVPRRFSLRRVMTPGGTPPHDTPPYTPTERQNPPPYSANPFVFECPTEPLVPAEIGPAREAVTRSHQSSPTPRRFSLRPAQIGVPPAPASPKPIARQLPRWKGGMLERQISELNLQRRVRAFSLSDVNTARTDRPTAQTSPLALPNATSQQQQQQQQQQQRQTRPSDEPTNNPQSQETSVVSTNRVIDETDLINPSAARKASSPLAAHTPQKFTPSPLANSTHKFAPSPLVANSSLTVPPNTFVPSSALTSTVHKLGPSPLVSRPAMTPSSPANKASKPQAPQPPLAVRRSGVNSLQKSSDKQVSWPQSPSLAADATNPFVFHAPTREATVRSASPSDLESVVVEKPSYDEESLLGVKVVKAAPTTPLLESSLAASTSDESGRRISKQFVSGGPTTGGSTVSQQSGTSKSDGPSRKVSTMSQQSGGSSKSEASTRKISTMSQQSGEFGSPSRKTSVAKPRVSVESYKTVSEFTIEKPTTNPFQQYRDIVERKRRDGQSEGSAS